MLGGRAGGRAWRRESPALTLMGWREKKLGGGRLPPRAGGLTALQSVGLNVNFLNMHKFLTFV